MRLVSGYVDIDKERPLFSPCVRQYILLLHKLRSLIHADCGTLGKAMLDWTASLSHSGDACYLCSNVTISTPYTIPLIIHDFIGLRSAKGKKEMETEFLTPSLPNADP